MKSKLFCVALCVLMMLSLALPVSAAKEMFQIQQVDLKITAPQVGANPTFQATCITEKIFVVSDAPFPFVNGINWHQYNPDNDLVESNTFQAGMRYRVTIRVRARSGEGGSFLKDSNGVPSITATVNGITASVAPVAGTKDVDITLQFAALPKALTSASVTGIDAPVAGQALDYTASVGSSDYKLQNRNDSTFKNGITWYDATDMKYVSTSHKAIAGHEYTVEIHVVPAGGATFSDSTTGSVNGHDIGEVGGGGNEIALVYDFPACADEQTQLPTVEVPASVSGYKGDSLSITCKATGKDLSYIWYETSTGKLQDIIAVNRGTETSATFKPDTSSAGTRYYVCAVSTADGGMVYSSVIPVTIYALEPEITTTQLPEATVGEKYTCTLACTDPDATFSIFADTGNNDFGKTGLSLSRSGKLEGTPTKAGNYRFNVCVSGEGGEGYMTYILKVVEAPDEETDPDAETTEPVEETAAEQTQETADDETVSEEQEETPKSSKDKKAQKDKEDEEDGEDGMDIMWILIPVIAVVAIGAGVAVAVLLMKKRNK